MVLRAHCYSTYIFIKQTLLTRVYSTEWISNYRRGKSCRKTAARPMAFQYTVPSPSTYPYQWLWDSCFHVIVLSSYDPDAAKAEMRSFMSKQFENGMLPHMIYWVPGELHNFEWGVTGTSALTQPPMMAYAAWEIFRHTQDVEFLSQIYPGTIAYYRYLVTTRDPRGANLASIINPDESGEDNSLAIR
jgi:hypothetical protein